ncbi:sodium:solute symporter family protein [Streptomyces phytohabitans]|uniref:sodium:solute symporter family protein n=1 Tax=Streptomyces phytohabitans TaxID=1150371 RepID=UPI00345C5AA9
MSVIDWVVIGAYFFVMVAIGWWSKRRVRNIADFFTGDGRIPWWLSGISHHVSGYSAVLFVAFAAVAYDHGLTVYVWWALTIGLGVGVGAFLFAPRWNRLRSKHGVKSPLEYLARRYDLPTQQVLAYSGAALKVVDIASKWVAISVLLQGFADIPMAWGIGITGVATMAYMAVGGLWADVLTDFGQFLIQLTAGFTMLFATMSELGGFSSLWTMWDDLPESHSDPVAGPVSTTLIMAFLLVKTFEYNGGMWNLAQRYMSAPSGSQARRSALLSSGLWLVWPFILFLPMFAAPLIVPGLENSERSYIEMAQELLPAGLIGLLLAGFFSNTMSMVASDTNVITAVITRDIAPVLVPRVKSLAESAQLTFARVTTVVFVAFSMTIAIATGGEGFVLDVVVSMVAATMGPISIPLMLGMLPWFRTAGPLAALVSWAGGMGVWTVVKWVLDGQAQATVVGLPLVTSLVLYVGIALVLPDGNADRDALIDSLGTDPETAATPAGTGTADAGEPGAAASDARAPGTPAG